ncbi:hypothetical protein GCM10010915_11650 [Microbacterium faecale]|uniref:Uncharacterized protein n=2 Tax=Microbacterium faecale TaxID=1804630 RepID=A0A916Y778_9MICO|nr:hypothetical protein GCM10010915_11650 [Microbacterium faecale]
MTMTDQQSSEKHQNQDADEKANERWDSEGGASDAQAPEDPPRTRRERAWDAARIEHWHGAKSTSETQQRADKWTRDHESDGEAAEDEQRNE